MTNTACVHCLDRVTRVESSSHPKATLMILKKTIEVEKEIVDTTKDDVTINRNTASDTNIEMKDTKENEFGPGKMNEASNRMEIVDPLEVFDKMDTIKSIDKLRTGREVKSFDASTDLTSLEVDVPQIIDNIDKVVNNDEYSSGSPSRLGKKSRIILLSLIHISEPTRRP